MKSHWMLSCFAWTAVAHPVILQNNHALMGKSVHDFVFFRMDGSKEIPVRWQIDEKNDRDEYVLDIGLPFTAHTDDQQLDANDELVVDTSDFGECAARLATQAHLVTNDGRCLYWRQDAKKSWPTAVEFDAAASQIISSQYRYQFDSSEPIRFGMFAVKHLNQWKTLIERGEFLFHFETPWYLPNMQISPLHMRSEIECWKKGPIRTIVAVGVRFKKLLSLFNLHLFSELVFYERSMSVPTKFVLEVNPSKFLKRGTFMAYSLDIPLAFSTEGNIPKLVPKTMATLWDEGQRAASNYVQTLRIAHQPLRLQVRIDEKLTAASLPPYLWNEREVIEVAGAYPWIKSLPGGIGILVDTSALRKGSFDFSLDLALENEADGDIAKAKRLPTVSWAP